MAYHSTIRERVLYSLVSLKEDEIIWLVRKIHTTRILERIMGILVTDIYSIGLLIGRNVCNWIILSREKCFWVWLVCGRMFSVSQPSQACEASLLTIRQFINCAFLEISLDRTLLCTAYRRFSNFHNVFIMGHDNDVI